MLKVAGSRAGLLHYPHHLAYLSSLLFAQPGADAPAQGERFKVGGRLREIRRMDVSADTVKIIHTVQMRKLRPREIPSATLSCPSHSREGCGGTLSFLSMHVPHYPRCPGKPSRLRPETTTVSANGNQEKREKQWLAGSFGGESSEGTAKQAPRVQNGDWHPTGESTPLSLGPLPVCCCGSG